MEKRELEMKRERIIIFLKPRLRELLQMSLRLSLEIPESKDQRGNTVTKYNLQL